MQDMEGQIVFAVLVILSVAVWFDLRTDKVPNMLILVGYIVGAVFRIGRPPDILVFLESVVLPIALLYPLFLIRGLGAGDIKLFSVISIFYSHEGLFWIMIYSLFVGAGICIANRGLCIISSHCKVKRYIHYTVCILAGYIMYVIWEGDLFW